MGTHFIKGVFFLFVNEKILIRSDRRGMQTNIQLTLVISKSSGLSEILPDIHISTSDLQN